MVQSERVSAVRLELTLAPDVDLGCVVSLAQREAACCPFFRFTIEVGTDALVLAVEVPDGGSEVLDRLLAEVA